MSYSDSFPAQRPSFIFDAANSGRIPPNATFSRSDSPIDATKAAASAVHYRSNEKHLSSENLIPYSNLSSGFSFGQTTLDSSNNSAPDGGSDAVLVLETADNSKHEVYRSFSCTTGTQYSFLVYVKANGRDKVILKPQLTSVIAQVRFDLTAVTSTVIAGSADSHSITAIGSTGWYKCAVTATATATGTGYTQVNLADSGGSDTYLGDVTKGAYLWGAQVSSTGETVLNETSGQIARSYAPTLKSVATAGAARFEYDPETNASRGILIESQTANLNTYSEDFSDGSYNKYDGSIETNAAIAPDGSLTADLFVEDTGTSTHVINKGVPTGLSVGTTKYAISLFAKAAGRSQIQMYDNGQSTSGSTVFDLANGTVLSGGGYIEACGNGWYRCTIIPTADYGTSGTPTILLHNGSGTNYQGDGYSGILLWGLQLETGNGSGTSFSSSYISTLLSARTRAADSLSADLSDIGYTGGDFTVIAEANMPGDNVGNVAEVGDGTASNRATLQARTDGTQGVTVSNAGSVQAYIGNTSARSAKRAMRVATNNFGYCESGGTVATDTAGVVPVTSTLYLGKGYSGSELNGTIKRVAIYSEALSDTNIQSLTAS